MKPEILARIEALRTRAERFGKPAIGRMPSGRWLCVGEDIMRSAEDPAVALLYWKLQRENRSNGTSETTRHA